MNSRSRELVLNDCREALADHVGQLSKLRNSVITVTGGTGFVGTWIAEFISVLNDEFGFNCQLVLVAREIESFKKSRKHLNGRKDIQFIKADVRYTVDIPRETQWLIHGAANPNSRFHSTYPVDTMTTIANGTEAILRAVDRCSRLSMFLNLSSGWIYGTQPLDMKEIPENFSGGPILGSSLAGYAEAKRYGEALCSSFRSQMRLPIVNVRPFAFIGPYQELDTPWAVNSFIFDAMNRRPIRILGDGHAIRSYMYPSDMTFWLLRILTSAESGTSYNLGSSEEVSIKSLAERVAEMFSPKPEVVVSVPSNSGVSSRFIPSLKAAESNFDLKVRVSLSEALRRTVEWNRLNNV